MLLKLVLLVDLGKPSYHFYIANIYGPLNVFAVDYRLRDFKGVYAVQEAVNTIMGKILDESDRKQVVSYAFKHRREVSPILYNSMEERVRHCVRADGYRDPCDPKVPVFKVLNKLVSASVKYPLLQRAIIEVWADLKPELKEIANKTVQAGQNLSPLGNEDLEEENQENNLYSLVERYAEQIIKSYNYPRDEVRLMVIYTLHDMINNGGLTANEMEILPVEADIGQGGVHNEVDFEEWLAYLQRIPASSTTWDEINGFVESVSELTNQKMLERGHVLRLTESLNRLREFHQEELDYFELTNCVHWEVQDLDSEQCVALADMTEQLIELFKKHLEMRAMGFGRTKSESELRRKAIHNLEVEIMSIYTELEARLIPETDNEDTLGPENIQSNNQRLTEIDCHPVDVENLNKEPIVITKVTNEMERDIATVFDDENTIGMARSENQETEIVAKEKKHDCLPDMETSEDNSIESITTIKLADNNMGGFGCDSVSDNELIVDKDSNNPSYELDISAELMCPETGNSDDDKNSMNNTYISVPFEVLYKEIHVACTETEEHPRAWILLKACHELFGIRDELANLPTPTLIELFYLSKRVYYDPVQFGMQRKKIDKLANDIKTGDLSKAQAVMHFAASLPLVLGHSFDPLRDSLFYADYIPSNFITIYRTLVEHANKIKVPIIYLLDVEQKQNQSEEQRRRLTKQIGQLFNQYSAKTKTKIDAVFFPRYGKGPLQWIHDGIIRQDCSDEFRNRLKSTTSDNVFSLYFTGQKEISIADQKLANITAVKEGAMDKIQQILNLALAWVASCDESKPLDGFHYRAFKELQLLFDNEYDRWKEALESQPEDMMIAGCWMKQSLEQLVSYLRGVDNAVGYSG